MPERIRRERVRAQRDRRWPPAYLRGWCGAAATAVFLSASPWGYAGDPDVVVAGAFPGKALLIIDGGPPRAVGIGERTPEGVRVLSVVGDQVVFEVAGQKQALRPGERVANLGGGSTDGELVLSADSGGHFRTRGQINGAPVEFLVDTGATLVSLGRSDARRAGILFTQGRRALAQTANGNTPIWLVRIDALRVGAVTIHNVEAAVHESELPVALLGMSALERFDLRNDGPRLLLRRRY